MNRYVLLPLASLGLHGCNQSPPPTPDVTVAAAISQPEATPKPPDAVQPPKAEAPPVPPPVFPFPNDAAGKELPRIVVPPSPVPPPIEKFGKVPAARIAPGKLIAPDPLSKMLYAPPPLLPAKSKGLAPTAPGERVPPELGVGASAVPAKPRFAEAPGIAIKARDASVPPDLIPLGRQLADRASLDDPTAEPGNDAIVNRTPMPVLGQAGFLKVVLPDPFELGDQVKPKVAPAAEPSLAPVVVNPQRVK